MREITFRAKHVSDDSVLSDEWVFGDLLHTIDGIKHIHQVETDSYFEIIPETVGQFTGLYSANFDFIENPNQPAYFGDIIRFCNTEGYEFMHAIEWDDKLCCITIGRPYSRIYESGYFQPSKLEFEIISNIHDNPNLLK